jgi:type IV pilus assembly protein PilW
MKRWRGFSLVELMVAITLAMIVTAGVISVFIGSRSAFEATSGTAALTDGGRFALNFIANSVRGAGYMSCTTAPNVVGILNAGSPLAYGFNEALQGFEAVGTGPTVGAYAVAAAPVADGTAGDWVGGLDATLVGLPVQNNDVLVVRSTLKDAQTVYVQTIVDGAPSFTVNTNGSLAAGQLAVISDCGTKGVVFQITGAPPTTPPVLGATITHNAGGGPGNASSSFPPSLSFSPGAQVTPVDTVVYYIGVGADQDSALFAYDLNATGSFTASELVPDIEAMQILYGVDTTKTQTVTDYVTADKVVDFNTVMSVKVALLAASAPGSAHPTGAKTYNLLGTTVTAPNDTRSRQVFQETIALRNALP